MLYAQEHWAHHEPSFTGIKKLTTLSDSLSRVSFCVFESMYELILPIVIERQEIINVKIINQVKRLDLEIKNKIVNDPHFKKNFDKYYLEADISRKILNSTMPIGKIV